jgi:hypothetical protein
MKMKFNIFDYFNSVFWSKYFNIDNESYFKVHKVCSRLGGITCRNTFGYLFQFFSFGCMVYCEFSGLFYVLRHRNNVLEVAEAFGTIATAFLGIVKTLTFLLTYEEIVLLRKRVEAFGDGSLMHFIATFIRI